MTGIDKYLIHPIVLYVILLGTPGTGYPEQLLNTDNYQDILSLNQGNIYMEKISIREYKNQLPVHDLYAHKLSYSEKNKNIQVQQLEIKLTGDTKIENTLEADSANHNLSNRISELYGNIRYYSSSGGRLLCSYMRWDSDRDEIYVPGKFTIEYKDYLLTGFSLKTDSNLSKGTMENLKTEIK